MRSPIRLRFVRSPQPLTRNRPRNRWGSTGGGALLMTLLMTCLSVSLGCPVAPPATPPTITEKQPTDLAHKKLQRPPFPNMATPAWGQAVLDGLVAKADPALSAQGTAKAVQAALTAFNDLHSGSEQIALNASVAAFHAATSDADRALAGALIAAALALNPRAENYAERLTDAAGVAVVAGRLGDGSVVGQLARAMTAVAVGRIREGRKLVDVLKSDRVGGDGALFSGVARLTSGERSDATVHDFEKALRARPDSERARAALGRIYLELGFVKAGLTVLKAASDPSPYLAALLGRAEVMNGQRKTGIARLHEAAEAAGEQRAGEILYQLGRGLLTTSALDEVSVVAAKLSQQTGYRAQAATLQVLLDVRTGQFQKAAKAAELLAHARGIAPAMAIDIAWAQVDACAALGDVACVHSVGQRAARADGNVARLQHARAALVLIGKYESPTQPPKDEPWRFVDVDRALVRAHRLSPFDPELGKRVHKPAVAGGPLFADLVRAARNARRANAPKLAAAQLKRIATPTCRVCLVVQALCTHDADQAARRAAQAILGKGPKLALPDLLDAINLLGGSPITLGAKALAALKNEKHPAIQKAVVRALAERDNPAVRKAREEKEHHDSAKPGKAGSGAPMSGTIPVPGFPGLKKDTAGGAPK